MYNFTFGQCSCALKTNVHVWPDDLVGNFGSDFWYAYTLKTSFSMYTCMYMYNVHMYVCMYVHVCTYVYMYVCMYVCTYTCMYNYMYI